MRVHGRTTTASPAKVSKTRERQSTFFATTKSGCTHEQNPALRKRCERARAARHFFRDCKKVAPRARKTRPCAKDAKGRERHAIFPRLQKSGSTHEQNPAPRKRCENARGVHHAFPAAQKVPPLPNKSSCDAFRAPPQGPAMRARRDALFSGPKQVPRLANGIGARGKRRNVV